MIPSRPHVILPSKMRMLSHYKALHQSAGGQRNSVIITATAGSNLKSKEAQHNIDHPSNVSKILYLASNATLSAVC